MPEPKLALCVYASHGALRTLVEGMVRQGGLEVSAAPRPEAVRLVLDNPHSWALDALAAMSPQERLRAVVSTSSTHPVYLDCLASYQPNDIFFHTDAEAALAAIHHAARGVGSYRRHTKLSFRQLQIVRLLLKGNDTKTIARRLRVAEKTVNSHLSNILCEFGYKGRTQLVASILGNRPEVDG